MVRFSPLYIIAAVFLSSSPGLVDEDIFQIGLDALKGSNFHFAIACFHDVIQGDPKNSQAYYYRGLAYEGKGDHEKALRDFREAAQLNPKHAPVLAKNSAAAYSSRGLARKSNGDYAEAVKDFDEVIRINPNGAEAFNNRGLAYVGKRDFDRAIADFTEAIRLYPRFADAYNNRGLAFRCKKDDAKARKDIEEAKRLNPRLSLFPPREFWNHYHGAFVLEGHFWFSLTPLDWEFDFDLGGA